MRKFFCVWVLLLALPVRAELPGYSLQVLCFADEDVCKMVLGQMVASMVVGLQMGAESTGDEFLAVTMPDTPEDTLVGFKNQIVGEGVKSALAIKSEACAVVVSPLEMVARVKALDNDLIRDTGISAANLVLTIVREINRESCKKMAS